LSDNTVRISQVSDYPWKGNITIQIDPEKKKVFTLKLRIPYWTTDRAITAIYTGIRINYQKIQKYELMETPFITVSIKDMQPSGENGTMEIKLKLFSRCNQKCNCRYAGKR